jgi:hypothetical protein
MVTFNLRHHMIDTSWSQAHRHGALKLGNDG